MNINAIRNHIVFQFLDKVNNKGVFEEEKSAGGIIIQSSIDASASQPRWATIVSLGPDCSDDLRADDCEILIENLGWTMGVEFNSQRVWRTDESKVIACRYPDGSSLSTFEV